MSQLSIIGLKKLRKRFPQLFKIVKVMLYDFIDFGSINFCIAVDEDIPETYHLDPFFLILSIKFLTVKKFLGHITISVDGSEIFRLL